MLPASVASASCGTLYPLHDVDVAFRINKVVDRLTRFPHEVFTGLKTSYGGVPGVPLRIPALRWCRPKRITNQLCNRFVIQLVCQVPCMLPV